MRRSLRVESPVIRARDVLLPNTAEITGPYEFCAIEGISMIDGGVTAGERLCNFVNHRLLKSDVWGTLEGLLDTTGRSAQLVLFFRELSAVTLTGRIVTAGQSLSVSFETLDDPGFRKVYTEHLRDVAGIPTRLLDELFRHSLRAVAAAIDKTPPSVAKNMKAWAIQIGRASCRERVLRLV